MFPASRKPHTFSAIVSLHADCCRMPTSFVCSYPQIARPQGRTYLSGDALVDSAPGKFSLRPTTPQDLEKLRGFLARAFGAGLDAPFVNPALMAWKHWDPRQDWSSPRSHVLEQGDEIVTHAGLWPTAVGSWNEWNINTPNSRRWIRRKVAKPPHWCKPTRATLFQLNFFGPRQDSSMPVPSSLPGVEKRQFQAC
jgi:hypothetical protein